MSNTITATIGSTRIIVAERNDMGLVCEILINEARPATFADADTALAFASLARTEDWELNTDGHVEATVTKIDNRFNGTVAARLDQAVGTTHEPFQVAFAHEVRDGDLIGDMDLEGFAVVAGSRMEGDTARIHMVGEMKTWEDRHTTDFHRNAFVQVARRKA